MNELTKKAMVAMLAAIKDYCGGNADCEGCPLRRTFSNGEAYCRLDGVPNDWELYGLEDGGTEVSE